LSKRKLGINHNAAVNLVWGEISGFGQVLKQSFQLAGLMQAEHPWDLFCRVKFLCFFLCSTLRLK
jgi:hypothetical protein